MYSQKVFEHFRNPHNFGTIDNPSALGQVGNLACGDVMKLYLKIDKNKEGEDYIQDIKFETLGCAAAIATSSVVTDIAMGKTLKEAMEINNNDVIKALDDLPAVKIHCSLLAVDALTEAIYGYYKKTGQEISPDFEQKHKRIITCQTRLKH
jgi:nitrogen fixation NifU-like protein